MSKNKHVFVEKPLALNKNQLSQIEKASIKVVTQDSVNMVYESLSTQGQTLIFNMKYIKMNKIVF